MKSNGAPKGIRIPVNVSKLLNNLSVSELAALSKLSKSYISQVKNGKRNPSDKLLQAILQTGKPSKIVGLQPSPTKISSYLSSLNCTIGGKHAYYRAISVFFHWLYSQKSGFEFSRQNNPIDLVEPPKRARLLLPCLNKNQVLVLIEKAMNVRDRAIISLFTESGLRLSELLNIKKGDICWETHTIKVLGKGNKEGLAPFGNLTELYLKEWLNKYESKETDSIWGVGFWGIKSMLKDLGNRTGLQCNPHTFRRTFAVLLRKEGIDSLTIQHLGRWESPEMVQRYTRSFSFQDSMKFYRSPLS